MLSFARDPYVLGLSRPILYLAWSSLPRFSRTTAAGLSCEVLDGRGWGWWWGVWVFRGMYDSGLWPRALPMHKMKMGL